MAASAAAAHIAAKRVYVARVCFSILGFNLCIGLFNLGFGGSIFLCLIL